MNTNILTYLNSITVFGSSIKMHMLLPQQTCKISINKLKIYINSVVKNASCIILLYLSILCYDVQLLYFVNWLKTEVDTFDNEQNNLSYVYNCL